MKTSPPQDPNCNKPVMGMTAVGFLTFALSAAAWLQVSSNTWASIGWVACLVLGCLGAALVKNSSS